MSFPHKEVQPGLTGRSGTPKERWEGWEEQVLLLCAHQAGKAYHSHLESPVTFRNPQP